jgi:hypothetical protein
MVHRYKLRMPWLQFPIYILGVPNDIRDMVNYMKSKEVEFTITELGHSDKYIVVESQAGAGSHFEVFSECENDVWPLHHITSLIKKGTQHNIYEARVVENMEFMPELMLKPKKEE